MVNKIITSNILSILKWSGIFIIALILIIAIIVLTARAITYFSNRITTENGVDEQIYVTLGGQEQYLLIRGEDITNPVIIWLHGGPSGPDAYVNYVFQKYLVANYTIVNWDQRGCGRTYYRNINSDANNDTATFKQAQVDLDELVDYVRMRFDAEKVIIVGHSYGTMLGSQYVFDHPDKVSAYIGVGQVVSIESEICSYEDALRKATENGDDTSAMETAYHAYVDKGTLVDLINLRKHTSKYHIAEKAANTMLAGIVSPYMGVDDLKWFFKQVGNLGEYFELNHQLYDYTMITDIQEQGCTYQVPVGFISGSDDWITPVKYSEDYFQLINAPEKSFCLIDGCGHSPQYDDPKAFCCELKRMLDEYIK